MAWCLSFRVDTKVGELATRARSSRADQIKEKLDIEGGVLYNNVRMQSIALSMQILLQ
jgi:hypothetical protein